MPKKKTLTRRRKKFPTVKMTCFTDVYKYDFPRISQRIKGQTLLVIDFNLTDFDRIDLRLKQMCWLLSESSNEAWIYAELDHKRLQIYLNVIAVNFLITLLCCNRLMIFNTKHKHIIFENYLKPTKNKHWERNNDGHVLKLTLNAKKSIFCWWQAHFCI